MRIDAVRPAETMVREIPAPTPERLWGKGSVER
jgi:hypothetical protein